MTDPELKQYIRKLPLSPGLYFFMGAENKLLYIGKASNLRSRLGHYLKTDNPRMKRMVVEAKRITTEKTGNDIEALILESRYIKKYDPPFNIMFRDDKQYFYVGFTVEQFPKLFLTHQPFQKFQKQGFWKRCNYLVFD